MDKDNSAVIVLILVIAAGVVLFVFKDKIFPAPPRLPVQNNPAPGFPMFNPLALAGLNPWVAATGAIAPYGAPIIDATGRAVPPIINATASAPGTIVRGVTKPFGSLAQDVWHEAKDVVHDILPWNW